MSFCLHFHAYFDMIKIIRGDIMKRRGFTLVELLGVIIILGLLALVTIPTISDSLSKYKKKLCNTQIEYMIAAAKNWGADHIYQLPDEGETVKITLSELIKQGYMEGDQKASQEEDRYKVKNPRSQKYFDPDPTITITKTGKKVNYTIDETTQSSCTGVK